MVKSKMVVLTEREKTDMANVDVAVDWILYAITGALMVK
jgi:hypothetical protein